MGRGLAVLGVPLWGGKLQPLIITTFTQALGDELLTNGDFSAWTGDNPDGWTVVGEVGADPELTERAPNAGHADAVGVGGAANFYKSANAVLVPRIEQNVLTVGHWYERSFEVTNLVASGAGFPGAEYALSPRNIWRATGIEHRITLNYMAGDVTVDNASAKRITLNDQQAMPSADAIVDFTYTLPAAPLVDNTINVFYRISDASLEAGYTCWRAYLQRNGANNAWGFRLDSVSAGTATNRINVTGVGDAVGIRVQCAGSLHDCWTTTDGTAWTKRGAQVNVSLNNTSKGINTVYCSGTTPTQLTVTP